MPGTTSLSLASRNLWMLTQAYATANALPSGTIAVGGAWGQSWGYLGDSQGGFRLAFNLAVNQLKIDQTPVPVLQVITDENITLESNLTDINTVNLQAALGQGSVATTSGTPGYYTLDIAGLPTQTYLSVAAEVQAQDGNPFRIFFPYALPVGSPTMGVTAEALTQIQARFAAFPDANRTPNLIARIQDTQTSI